MIVLLNACDFRNAQVHTFGMNLQNAVAAVIFIVSLAATGHAQDVDNLPARNFNAAAALQNAGLYGRATQKWTEFISNHATDSRIGRAHYFLGVCQLHEKKFDQSIASFQTVLQRWPSIDEADKAQYNLAMSRLELATAQQQLSGLQQASRDFEIVRSKYPMSELADDALYFQGECLQRANDLPAAIKAYQTLIAQYAASPHAARAYYDLGVTQQTMNDFESALKTYETFLSKPEYSAHELASEVGLRFAICLQARGELDRAAEQFSKVSQVPGFEFADYAILQVGQIKHDQTKYAEAATFLRDFPARYPQSEHRGEALKLAGHSYYLADQPQQAIDLLGPLANSDDPQGAEAAYWMGRAQLKLNQPDQALQSFEKGLARFGSSPFLPYLKFARIDAIWLIRSRQAEAPSLYEVFAKEHLTHALAAQATYMVALTSFNLEQYTKAKETAESNLHKPGDDAAIAGDLLYIAAEANLLEKPDDTNARSKAETYFRDLVAKYPAHDKSSHARLRIGWCLQAADKHNETIQWLRTEIPKLEIKQQLPEAYLLVGNSHLALEQLREALTSFDAGIAANESWERVDELIIAAADCHRKLDQVDQAIARYRRIVDSFPDSKLRSQALYSLGEIASRQSKVDEAIGWFQQITTQYANTDLNGPAMQSIATLFFAEKKFAQACEWATRVIDDESSADLKLRAQYLRGLAFHGERKFDRAIEDLNSYRNSAAASEEGLHAAYVISLCHAHSKQFEQARSQLNALLKAKPDFLLADRAYYELGHALLGVEDKVNEAAVAFEWIVANRPDSPLMPESCFRIAQHQLDLAKKVDDANRESSFQQAISTLTSGLSKATDAELRENMQYMLGDIQFQSKRFTDAITTLSKYISEFPNGKFVGPVTFLIAQCKYEMKQYDQALPLFVKLNQIVFGDLEETKVNQYREQSLYRAGECAANLKQWQESESLFRKLIQEHPQFVQRADAQYGLAYSLQQQTKLDAAIEAYLQVTKECETETAAKARFMMGEIEFERKKYEDAIEHFLLVTVGYPYETWQALGRFETARCFNELGDKNRATKTLREMIEKHPNHTRIPDAKKMLSDWEK